MKRTQVIELLANIRKTIVSFFSILMFVALGVGIFLGISWAGPALINAAENVFNEGSFHNFQLQYIYGMTDNDLKKLSELEGVTDVEPARQSFQTISKGDSPDVSVKVQSLTERIDVLTTLEGELPTKANEIALGAVAAKKYGYKVGDTITFEKDASESGDSSTSELIADDSTNGQTADKDGMKYLNSAQFTITALVKSPEYIAKSSQTYGFSTSSSGSVDLLAWVPASAFDSSAYQNGYPVVNLTCNSLAGLSTLSDEYKVKSNAIEEPLTTLSTSLADARFDDLHEQAEKKINDAEAQLNEGKQKIADGEKQLEDGRAELESKRAEGEAQLASAYDQLIYYEGLKQQGEIALAEGRAKVAEGEDAMAQADAIRAGLEAIVQDGEAYDAEQYALLKEKKITQKEYDKALDKYGASLTKRIKDLVEGEDIPVPDINHENFEIALIVGELIDEYFDEIPVEYEGETLTIGEARDLLEEGKEQLADAENYYYEKVTELNNGWAQYYAGQEQLQTAVAEGEQKLADAEAELNNAKQQVAENEPKLEEAKSQLAQMKRSKCMVMSRAYNAGVVQIDTFSSVTGNLSISMAALFIIVGLLVSYSAVSRIVHEQISQIGTKKALGMYSKEITLSFLLYSALAVISGAIIGTVVSVFLVERIIGTALAGMFIFGSYPPYFDFVLFALVTLLELVLVIGATWLACRRILKQNAVELLRGEQPPAGKTRFYEKWGIWKKMPLFSQTVVNNCMNDKRRVFSTVVGVAGCTALIITAITLNNNVLRSYDVHYDDVYCWNALVIADTSTEGAIDNLEKALEDNGATATPILRKGYILTLPDGTRGNVHVVVPENDDSFSELYHVDPLARKTYDSSAEGAWVSQAYAEHYGAKAGDNIVFEDTDGKKYEVPILGFDEFLLTYHEIVMNRDYYEKLTGEPFKANILIANTNGTDVSELGDKLSNVPGFDSISDDKINQHGNFETFSTVSSAVVLIYIILSALMAVVVLLNLNTMFISEKKRELIVLMINGYSVKDAKRYIYSDTIVLSVIGILLGVVVGCAMGSITVTAVEPSTASFLKGIDWMSVFIGIVGSAVLSAIMSFISLRSIPKFNLTDIGRL